MPLPAAGGRRGAAPARAMAGDESPYDLIRLGLCLFIIVTISTVHAYVAPLRMIRPGLLAWAMVAGGVFLAPRMMRWDNITRFRPAQAMVALALIALASVPFALSVGQAGSYYLFVYIRVVLFFLLLVAAIRGARDLLLFTRAFVISIGTLAVLAMTIIQLASSHGGVRLQSSVMYDANDLGVLFVTALPLAILMVELSKGMVRWSFVALLGLIPAAMALTGSRGAMVGLAVVGPALFLVMSHVSLVKRVAGVLVVAGGLVVAAPEGYWDRMATILAPTDDYNYSDYYGRTEIAKRGLGYMLGRPITGVGIANFGRADGDATLARTLDSGQAVRWIAPHNTYVQVGAELGIFALGIWIMVILSGAVGLARQRSRVPKTWARGTAEQRLIRGMTRYLPVSFLGFAVTSVFTSHAYTPPLYILAALLVGTQMLMRRAGAGPAGRPMVRRPGAARPAGRRAAYYGPAGLAPASAGVAPRIATSPVSAAAGPSRNTANGDGVPSDGSSHP